MKKQYLIAFLIAVIGGTGTFFALKSTDAQITSSISGSPAHQWGALPVELPQVEYGFVLDTFQIFEGKVEANQTIADILLPHQTAYAKIDALAKKARDIFDVRQIRPNKKYLVLSTDSSKGPDFLIYEPDVFGYVVFDLRDSIRISYEKKKLETRISEASGIIYSSLWQTMVDNGLSYDLTARMEDAFAWSIDFYHIQNGDKFKLIFEEKLIDGEVVGVGDIHAAYFQNGGTDFYAYFYESENYRGFFDENARPMKKAFLKSPVKYSRISSRFNPRRFHPVLKRVKPHLGTDYAAPYGTPIYAVANGVITKASYTSGNGNYVKIKHDKVYETQYLHMQRIAKGIYPGVQVKQGQVIGYVGSTGLATGPHVCFRFWKNGRQVNHLRENLPPPEPMKESELPFFFEVQKVKEAALQAIPFPETTNKMKSNEEEV